MVGESGNAKTKRYAYYKCVNNKRAKTCDKKAVKKDWIENIVIDQVIKFINDDELIERLINNILEYQDKESPTLKALKKQFAQTNHAVDNMISAIEQGIITRSTKQRLGELENTRDSLETEIAKESMTYPTMDREFLKYWFKDFKRLNTND